MDGRARARARTDEYTSEPEHRPRLPYIVRGIVHDGGRRTTEPRSSPSSRFSEKRDHDDRLSNSREGLLLLKASSVKCRSFSTLARYGRDSDARFARREAFFSEEMTTREKRTGRAR